MANMSSGVCMETPHTHGHAHGHAHNYTPTPGRDFPLQMDSCMNPVLDYSAQMERYRSFANFYKNSTAGAPFPQAAKIARIATPIFPSARLSAMPPWPCDNGMLWARKPAAVNVEGAHGHAHRPAMARAEPVNVHMPAKHLGQDSALPMAADNFLSPLTAEQCRGLPVGGADCMNRLKVPPSVPVPPGGGGGRRGEGRGHVWRDATPRGAVSASGGHRHDDAALGRGVVGGDDVGQCVSDR
ncbi:uncharacterized protein LOC143486804 [Brachyhypopomus gauderio]|uniref:uncharacterized protein LOC143486804 n=1 Tax=Brachyhypopomus gauderio TaxID=698409 RepID=UPI004041E6AC